MIDRDKLTTYMKRDEILKLKIDGVHKDSEYTMNDWIAYAGILNEIIENLANIVNVYGDSIDKYEHGLAVTRTALRFYAKEFGSPVIMEKDVDFGERVTITATVLPIDDDPEHVKIIVDWERVEDDN